MSWKERLRPCFLHLLPTWLTRKELPLWDVFCEYASPSCISSFFDFMSLLPYTVSWFCNQFGGIKLYIRLRKVCLLPQSCTAVCLLPTNLMSQCLCFWTILFQLQVHCKECEPSSCIEICLLNDIGYLGCSVPQTPICSWAPDSLYHLVSLFAAGYICISIWLFKGSSLSPSLQISF